MSVHIKIFVKAALDAFVDSGAECLDLAFTFLCNHLIFIILHRYRRRNIQEVRDIRKKLLCMLD